MQKHSMHQSCRGARPGPHPECDRSALDREQGHEWRRGHDHGVRGRRACTRSRRRQLRVLPARRNPVGGESEERRRCCHGQGRRAAGGAQGGGAVPLQCGEVLQQLGPAADTRLADGCWCYGADGAGHLLWRGLWEALRGGGCRRWRRDVAAGCHCGQRDPCCSGGRCCGRRCCGCV